MIDPLPPIAPLAALALAPGASDLSGSDAASSTTGTPPVANAPAAPEPRREAVALSVDRDTSGVFVYTLTDTASGRVLAVIPRSAVAPVASDARAVDLQA